MRTDMKVPVFDDEVELIAQILPCRGCRIAEVGCGAAGVARQLLQRSFVCSVYAFEVDRVQHSVNVAAPPIDGLQFGLASADALPLADRSVDAVLMLKSLHHVPIGRMDAALDEARRVLRPGGVLYVSEPLCEGPFNDLVQLFHDESVVRSAAYESIRRAADHRFVADREIVFASHIRFRDFDDFERRIIGATHTEHHVSSSLLDEVRSAFERHVGAGGAVFRRRMRANALLRGE